MEDLEYLNDLVDSIEAEALDSLTEAYRALGRQATKGKPEELKQEIWDRVANLKPFRGMVVRGDEDDEC